jgi:excisionase family DNA binding protein
MHAASLEIGPDAVDAEELRAVQSETARLRLVGRPARLVDSEGQGIELPEELFDLLVAAVEELNRGNGFSIVPMHARLTTAEAAELLNVSRPHLIKQLESGALPFTMVGTHRRVLLSDVLAYREARDRLAEEAMQSMTDQAEELGLYDD